MRIGERRRLIDRPTYDRLYLLNSNYIGLTSIIYRCIIINYITMVNSYNRCDQCSISNRL